MALAMAIAITEGSVLVGLSPERLGNSFTSREKPYVACQSITGSSIQSNIAIHTLECMTSPHSTGVLGGRHNNDNGGIAQRGSSPVNMRPV